MGTRIVNFNVVVFDPKSFCALIVTWRFNTDCVGVPEITPVFVFNVNPVGNEPDWTENVMKSPVYIGVAEKELPFVRVYSD